MVDDMMAADLASHEGLQAIMQRRDEGKPWRHLRITLSASSDELEVDYDPDGKRTAGPGLHPG